MENKKKNIIIILTILILLAVIIFGVCYFKNNKIQKVQTKNNQEIVEGGEKPTEVDVDNLVSGLKTDYKETKAFKECIAMDMGINSCYRDAVNQKISETGDVNLCNDLSNSSEKSNCVNNYYKNKAVKTGDKTLCDKTTDKDYCLESVITKKAEDLGDEGVCDELGDGYKRNCIQSAVKTKAIKTGNTNLCDKLVYTRVEGEGENKKEIKETMDADMCKEEVRMEIQMKKEEEAMKTQDLKTEVEGEKVEDTTETVN